MQGVDRTRRVAELIRRALAGIIRDRLPDRGLGLLSITATKITRDLSRATVFITILGKEEEDQNRKCWTRVVLTPTVKKTVQ